MADAALERVEDEYLLSPIGKWRKHGTFPCGLMLHVLLVAAAVYHLAAFNTVHGVTKRVIGQNFQAAFFPDDFAQYNGDDADNPTYNRYFIFTLPDLADALDLMWQRYWSLPLVTLVPTRIASADGIPFPRVYYTHLAANATVAHDASDPHPDITQLTDVVTVDSPTTPFPPYHADDPAFRSFLDTCLSLRYDFQMDVDDTRPDMSLVTPHGCRTWTVNITYDFTARNHIEVLWSMAMGARCQGDTASHTALVVITALTMLLVVVYETYTLGSVVRDILNYRAALARQHQLAHAAAMTVAHPVTRLRVVYGADGSRRIEAVPPKRVGVREGGAKPTTDTDDTSSTTTSTTSTSSSAESSSRPKRSVIKLLWLTGWDLLKTVRLWVVVSTLADLCLFAHCVLVAVARGDIPPMSQAFPLAFAASALMLSLLRYLDYSPGYYSTIIALRSAMPRILSFLIGVTPIFVALVLFAMVVFGRTEVRYANPGISFITLFAFFNGDALRETFTHTEATGNAFLTVVGDIHLCLTILMFTYVVINCIVALAEDAFFNTRTSDAHDIVRQTRLKAIEVRLTVSELLKPEEASGPTLLTR